MNISKNIHPTNTESIRNAGFPDDSMVKNLSANARDMDSIPSSRRALMLWSN